MGRGARNGNLGCGVYIVLSVFHHIFMIEIDFQRKKGSPKRTWKKQVEEENVKVVLRREDAFADQGGVFTLIRLLLG